MSMMSSSSPKPSSPPDISWFICSALVCFGLIIIIIIIIIVTTCVQKRERKKMMSVKAERAKERELKRLPARDREKPSHVHSISLYSKRE
jgi:heme/copper-type cytochrome/quinol oxidase subunit 2